MTTVADLVVEARSLLHAAWRPEQNVLQADITSGGTTIVCTHDLRGIVPGSSIAIGDEVMYVWTAHPETKTITVQRAVQGTAAAHTAGDLIEVNPTFPAVSIKRALKQEILSWPTTLFQVDTATVTASDLYRSQGIALNLGDYYNVLRVQHASDSGRAEYTKTWPDVSFWRHDRHPDGTDFSGATGALYLDQPVPSGSVKVTYSKPFTTSTWDDATDLESDVGLTAHMLDIPAIGAAWRLQSAREVARTLTSPAGDPRLSESVPPGTIIQGAFGLKQLRDQRIAEESRRLVGKYPLGHT